jgi:hypothetical protein
MKNNFYARKFCVNSVLVGKTLHERHTAMVDFPLVPPACEYTDILIDVDNIKNVNSVIWSTVCPSLPT